MSDGGKGSTPRPYSVSKKQFDDNWDAIFGKKDNTHPHEHDKAGDDGKPEGNRPKD